MIGETHEIRAVRIHHLDSMLLPPPRVDLNAMRAPVGRPRRLFIEPRPRAADPALTGLGDVENEQPRRAFAVGLEEKLAAQRRGGNGWKGSVQGLRATRRPMPQPRERHSAVTGDAVTGTAAATGGSAAKCQAGDERQHTS